VKYPPVQYHQLLAQIQVQMVITIGRLAWWRQSALLIRVTLSYVISPSFWRWCNLPMPLLQIMRFTSSAPTRRQPQAVHLASYLSFGPKPTICIVNFWHFGQGVGR
jgi:hypothetical protein